MEKNWYNLSVKETETKLETNLEEGLTTEQVTKAREKYGYNELKAQKKKSLFVKFLEQFKDFNFHIIINTHSNLMLSDIPKENVIVLDRKDNKTIIKNATSQTLAQNLFENLNNDFFLDKFIGGYIEDKIIAILKKDIITSDEKELINNLGEKILRVSLEMKYDIESK